MGRCPLCGKYDTFEEQSPDSDAPSSEIPSIEPVNLEEITDSTKRFFCGIPEFDRVIGGGIAPGQVILLGGEPGVGKSTLMLQLVAELGKKGVLTAYVSAEESAAQLKVRASRLKLNLSNCLVYSDNDLDAVLENLKDKKPTFAVFDSAQMLRSRAASDFSGSLAQVRLCTEKITDFSKQTGMAAIIIGHITKGGVIAGPKIMEHIVDSVLYFENEKFAQYRIIRSIKNRFGAVNEIAVFDMTATGLKSAEDFSSYFVENINTPGQALSCVMEGSRSILVEVQALLNSSLYSVAKRVVNGFDYNRAVLVLAILEKYTKMSFANYDIFINVVGGLKINDPGADLALAAALISIYLNKPLTNAVFWGELSLSGNIRDASASASREKESKKRGIENIVNPSNHVKNIADLWRVIEDL